MKPTAWDLLFPVFMVFLTIFLGTLIGAFFSGCAHIDDKDRYCRNTAGIRHDGKCGQDGRFRIQELR